MSSVVISGDTSGAITLAAPAVAGTNTITLPSNTGTVITTASSGQSIPKAALPTGSVLQVVSAAIATYVSSSSSAFADTGITATITPTSATSKILVLIDHAGCSKETNNTGLQIKVLRGATQIVYVEDAAGSTSSIATNFIGTISTNYLDSPATTSATTYKSQFASRANNALVSVGNYGSVPVTSTITLMEIAA